MSAIGVNSFGFMLEKVKAPFLLCISLSKLARISTLYYKSINVTVPINYTFEKFI